MTNPATPPRGPRVFEPDDPSVGIDPALDQPDVTAPADGITEQPDPVPARRGSFSWGTLFWSALAGLVVMAASLSFTQFITDAMSRSDWLGWLATALGAIATASLAVLAMRELFGLFRLARRTRLRRRIGAALRQKNIKAEQRAVSQLKDLYAGRPDQKWALARLKSHEGDIADPGDRLILAERELIAPLDAAAKQIILKTAKRVSVATALLPFVWLAMLYVLAENLRMLRLLAGQYGGRPGFIGSLRLARMVFTHILATGGLALTDDLFGQFLGQDLLRRLSRRLGEGMFNGALTARIGVAAIEVTRPMPYLEAQPVRIRDLLPELFRRTGITGRNKG